VNHLYSGDPGDVSKLRGRTRASLVARVRSVGRGSIQLERPLRFDVRPEWRATVLAFEPTVTESGVENLGFEFPDADYKGHFTELGFNPVAFSGAAHCWARNIRAMNPDSGFFIGGVFNTVDGVVMETRRKGVKQGIGHHGVYMHGDDNVFTHFDFRMRFIHDLTVSGCAGNVLSDGKGVDLDFDHHKATPYENLFTNIDAGEGTRLWACGGGAALGRQCAARGTFWNIRAKAALRYPPAGWGPESMNVVALSGNQPTEASLSGKWFEAISPGQVSPQNIHKAQLERRLAASHQGSDR
jgi:hypothetical protein